LSRKGGFVKHVISYNASHQRARRVKLRKG
jgi:hypothetical protein